MTLDEKTCPDCAETVKAAARKCRFCGYEFAPGTAAAPTPPGSASASVTPMTMGRVLPESDILDLLDRLVEKSLAVYEQDETGGGRYRLTETVRQYARDRLLESGEAEPLRDRHREYFLTLAEEAHAFFDGPEQALTFARLEAEHDNLRAALEWCRAREDGVQAGLRMAAALWEFWNVHGHLSEGLRWLGEILGREETKEPSARRAHALNGAGVMAVTRGDLAAARPFLEESLAVWRRLGSAEVVHTLTSLGYLAAREGDKAAEQASYEEALRLARGAGNRRFTLYPLRGLGDLARGRGDLPAAEAYLEESVAVAREFGDHKGLIWSLASLADVKSDRGDGAGADALREESAAVAAELRDSRSLLGTLPQVAHRAMLRGEYARARALYGRCLEAAREVEDVCAVGWGTFDLAVVAQHEGDYAQARRLFDEGLPLIRRAADEFMAAVAACQAAWYAWWRGDLEAAAHRSVQEESLARFRQTGHKGALSWARCYLAWAVYAQGDHALAGALFRETLSAPASRRREEQVVWCLEGLARVWVSQGRMEHNHAGMIRAARLLGACEAVRAAMGFVRPLTIREGQERAAATARAALGEAAFDSLLAEGKNMTPEQAVAYALEEAGGDD